MRPRRMAKKLQLPRITMTADERSSYCWRFARWSSRATGRPFAFFLAIVVIVAWACTGPLFGFSDTWQMVINTATTIVTFLMVFLIQNAQSRDSQAIQLRLNGLL